ncbi:proline--tRNA ligase [Candidatus Micrarchaeota archaeon]|nr:MAG: proline--tRNA ligase [Candidatus Micrarchaeota archaeon]
MNVPKSNFSEWYNYVLEEAEILDIRYPVKGMPVYKPWGFKIMRRCFDLLEALLNSAGHDASYFPLLVPEEQFAKEGKHIKGFGSDVLWATHGGEQELERKLALRPTSETIMYPMFALWIRSHADLPLKVHQTVCVYRHETKATKPLIRGREVYWNEAHTVHANAEEAEMQVGEGVHIYKRFFDSLGVPTMILKRPEYDTFPGAAYSLAFDALMPDGKTLQVGTVHNLGDNFSKAYGIQYDDAHGEKKGVYQTCYGISMRCLAIVIAVHGDDKGLMLPSSVAPVQAVLVPIFFGKKEELLKKCEELRASLEAGGVRTKIDDEDVRPGEKYYYWDARGVPLHIEIGPRELDAGKVVLVSRDGRKKSVDEKDVLNEVKTMLEEQDKRLYERASKKLQASMKSAKSIDELKGIMNKEKGFVKIGWCEEEKCAEKVEVQGAAEIRGCEYNKREAMKCVACGKEGIAVWAAKAY